MAIAQLTLEIRIEHARSLKDRRQVVRSLKDQLRQGFNISVSELAAISNSRDYLRGQIEEVERAAQRMIRELGAEVADSWWDFVDSGPESEFSG
jgi:hypothetical protein